MKKILLIVLVFTVLTAAAFAGDFSFAFEDALFHGDFLGGFAPIYVRAGVDYTGFELIEDQRTDFYIIGGGALVSSSLWTDQSGLPFSASAVDNTTALFDDYNKYSRWQGDFSLKLKQGLIHEEGRAKALFAVYGKYAFHLTSPHENWKSDSMYSNFLLGDASAYPDQAGNVTNIVQFGVELDRLDAFDVYDGFNVDASVILAPRWLANNLLGDNNFLNVNLTAKAFYSLLEIKRKESELTAFGIYLGDRVQLDYITGDAIPQFFQEKPALGSKMRGFEGMSMGTEFTAVNNFDVRLYGFEFIDNINPVINLFLDAGFFAGKYLNTDYIETGDVRLSTGFELALNIIDFAQVGYMFGFPLIGSNLQEEGLQTGIMFQYKF